MQRPYQKINTSLEATCHIYPGMCTTAMSLSQEARYPATIAFSLLAFLTVVIHEEPYQSSERDLCDLERCVKWSAELSSRCSPSHPLSPFIERIIKISAAPLLSLSLFHLVWLSAFIPCAEQRRRQSLLRVSQLYSVLLHAVMIISD